MRLKSVGKLAFTLAEVLIVIGVIGIVAELTLPSLIDNFLTTTYTTSAKKVYSDFNNVLTRITNDNGCTGDLKCTNFFNNDANAATSGATIAGYFKVAKNCGTSTTDTCFSNITPNYDRTGAATDYDSVAGYKFIANNGMSYFIANPNNDNCATNISMNRTNHLTQECGYIVVDTNGTKGPNTFGRDVFKFWISNGKGPLLYPAGGADDKNGGADSWWQTKGCGTAGDISGDDCAGRIMEQGWQMNY